MFFAKSSICVNLELSTHACMHASQREFYIIVQIRKIVEVGQVGLIKQLRVMA